LSLKEKLIEYLYIISIIDVNIISLHVHFFGRISKWS